MELMLWAFLPRRALSCLPFLRQPLTFTQPCRNLIFVRLSPHIKFDTCQWVPRFLGCGKADYCISRYHANTNLILMEKKIKKKAYPVGKGTVIVTVNTISVTSICFCTLLCLLFANERNTSKSVRLKIRGRESSVSCQTRQTTATRSYRL